MSTTKKMESCIQSHELLCSLAHHVPFSRYAPAVFAFYQDLPHEGEPVGEGCAKYIIRTDIMFRREPAICTSERVSAQTQVVRYFSLTVTRRVCPLLNLLSSLFVSVAVYAIMGTRPMVNDAAALLQKGREKRGRETQHTIERRIGKSHQTCSEMNRIIEVA